MSGQRVRSNLMKAGRSTGKCLKKAAWQTCKCVLWTCCAPCLCVAMLFVPHRRRGCVRSGPGMEYTKPEVPYPRERALTISSDDLQDDQLFSEQTQSAFIAKLPLEIRRMVYERALGGASIHMSTYDGRPYAAPCRLLECRCGNNDAPPEQKLGFAVPLLRTCRQIYSEAIEYLYTSNQFSLSTEAEEIPTIDYFSYYFLPQRLTLIHDLYLYWELDSLHYSAVTLMPDPVLCQWVKTWEALGKLTGLRQLRITLVFRYGFMYDYYDLLWKQKGLELLLPVKSITAPRDFVLILPDRRCSTDVDLGESRCILELPSGDDEASESTADEV